MNKLDLRLLRMMKHTKGQFIAVTLVLTIGLMSYVALGTNIQNLENGVNDYYDATNLADIFVEVVKIPDSRIDEVLDIQGITAVSGRIVNDVPLKVENRDEKVTVRIISVDAGNDTINNLYSREGGLIKDEGKDALLIEFFRAARDIQIDDTIRPQILGKDYKLNVAGSVSSSEYVYLIENAQTLIPDMASFGVLYVSHKFAENSFGLKGYKNELLVTIDDPKNAEKIIDELEKKLDKYGIKRIYKRADQLSYRMLYEEIRGNKEMSSAMPMIFLGVAGIVIAVMIGRIVKNDRIAIGVLKAMGYKNSRILMHYSKYSIAVGVVGSVLGLSLGSYAANELAKVYTATFFDIPELGGSFYPNVIIGGIVLATLFSIVSGLWGAKGVVKIHPAESMRPEAPKQGKRIFFDKIPIIWNRVSFSWKMVIKNVMRSKRRFAFISLGIGLTFAITLFPIFSINSMNTIFDVQFGEFIKVDYNINFNRSAHEKVIKDIKNIADIDDIEGKTEVPFELVHGWKNKIVTVIGLETDTDFYNFQDVKGRTTYLKKEGITLSEGLARFLGVVVGDLITVETYIPNRDDVEIRVTGIVKQSLGINAYMNIDLMQGLLLDENLITGVLVNTDDDLKGKIDGMQNVGSVQSMTDMRGVFEEFMGMTIASFVVMFFFIGSLGFVIVYNTTIMSINERNLEFSSLRVMGFNKGEIYYIIIRENFIMTVFGIMIGIPMGNYLIKSMRDLFTTEMYAFDANITPIDYFYCGVLTIIFTGFAQLATYGKIRRLDFVDALKNRMN